jgi:hypothetical protein
MPPPARGIVKHDLRLARQRARQLLPVNAHVRERRGIAPRDRQGVKCFGGAAGQCQSAGLVGLGRMDRRLRFAGGFGDDAIAIGVGLVAAALAIAGGTRNVAIAVDNLKWRVDVLKRDRASDDPESLGGQPLLEKLSCRLLGCAPAGRQKVQERVPADHLAHDRLGQRPQGKVAVRNAQEITPCSLTIRGVDRILQGRGKLNITSVAGEYERRLVVVARAPRVC